MNKDAQDGRRLHADWDGLTVDQVDAAIDALIGVLFEPVDVNGETLYRVRRVVR
jgi:hypothetical protein